MYFEALTGVKPNLLLLFPDQFAPLRANQPTACLGATAAAESGGKNAAERRHLLGELRITAASFQFQHRFISRCIVTIHAGLCPH